MSALHLDTPGRARPLSDRHRRLLRWVALAFALLALGAVLHALRWDPAITDAVVDARSDGRDDLALAISRLGSTPVVLAVAGLAAALAWPRRRPLAVAIVVLALARPLVEFTLKELVGRDRPAGHRLVHGKGPSFPSGHPFATAASWGFLPVVVALYTGRRALRRLTAVAAWTLVVLVAASRVWLGVHWASDALAGVLLAVLGAAVAERVITRFHVDGCRTPPWRAWGARATSASERTR